ncbi:MAG: outer membrane lipoprotein chaperone LolA [Gammaproteobacteria bacterium]|nr:outer membrane lipoprotein chaperone LolA [Gammaproteobacteria bacterium]
MNNKTMNKIAAIFFLFILSSVSVMADDGAERLSTFLKKSQTLQAVFEQTVFDADGGVSQQAKGLFYLSRPGRFRWDYTEPYKQLIVADGKNIWLYDDDLEQVTVKSQQSGLGDLPALLLAGGDQSLEKNFKIKSLGSSDSIEWLELLPNTEERSFERVRLGLKGSVLQEMELLDAFNQTTRLVFSDIKLGVKLSPSLFKFTPPKGVDVVGDVE